MDRDIISHSEGKLPVIRIIGFCTMIVAALSIGVAVWLDSSSGIAVCFFIIMLGYSFAFPELLEGNEGLSTMRIIVFMVTNVICMLLLKIGWDQSSLDAIGLDEWWMGVIAFVFGAKAVQSYFESRLTTPATPATPKVTVGADTQKELTDADYVNIAIGQNQGMLYAKGNVRLLAPGKKKVNNELIDCVTIHLKDNHADSIPSPLVAIGPSGQQRMVETEIIPDVEKPRVSYDAGDSVTECTPPDYKGSIGAMVQLADGVPCLLTCSHVMTKGSSINYNGLLTASVKSKLNDVIDGDWFYALRDAEFDIALIKNFTGNTLGLPDGVTMQKVSRDMVPEDTKKTRVTMIGRKDFYSNRPNKNSVQGYVVNYRAINAISLGYSDGDFELVNLMLLSTTVEPPYEALSLPGDSGSIVIDDNGIPIGLVVAQNSKFTYAISLNRILKKLAAKLV